MDMSLKNAIRGVFVAAAAMMAVAAHADVATPSSGNGELTLFVKNETTQEVYARGLQVTLNDVITEATAGAAYSGPTHIGYTLPTIAPDANLTSFMSAPSAAGFTWGLLAGDSVGSNAAGTRRYLLTSQVDLTAGNQPSNNNLGGLGTTTNTFFADLNANLPDVAGSSVRGTGSAGGLWGLDGTSGSGANLFFGQAPQNSSGPTGDTNALKLFVLTSAGGTSGATTARVFEAADVFLSSDGTLHAAASAPVPLPAAFWLLGSGLLGMVGVGRRRA